MPKIPKRKRESRKSQSGSLTSPADLPEEQPPPEEFEQAAAKLVADGRELQIQGQYDEAKAFYLDALKLDRAAGNNFNAAVTLALLGQVARDQGELEEAKRLLHQALELHILNDDGRYGARFNISSTLHTLGQVAQEQGHRWLARWYFLRSWVVDPRRPRRR